MSSRLAAAAAVAATIAAAIVTAATAATSQSRPGRPASRGDPRSLIYGGGLLSVLAATAFAARRTRGDRGEEMVRTPDRSRNGGAKTSGAGRRRPALFGLFIQF